MSATSKNVKKCMSGISTPRKHRLPKQPKCIEKTRAGVYKKLISNKILKQNNENGTFGFTTLER